jgi:hypothetical protein
LQYYCRLQYYLLDYSTREVARELTTEKITYFGHIFQICLFFYHLAHLPARRLLTLKLLHVHYWVIHSTPRTKLFYLSLFLNNFIFQKIIIYIFFHLLKACSSSRKRKMMDRTIKKREMIAWILVILQFAALSYYSLSTTSSLSFSLSSNSIDPSLETSTADHSSDNDYINRNLKMNDHLNSYYTQRRIDAIDSSSSSSTLLSSSYYEHPIVHQKDAGLVSRIWRSNGSPSIHPNLKQGSCWCSFDEWCVVRCCFL